MNHQTLIQAALDCGATKATVISQEQIVTSAAFRDICVSNGCGMYGKCWMCPPDAGDIDVLMAEIRKYTHGLWYQTIRDLEDSFDFEGMSEAGRLHVLVSHKLQGETVGLLPAGSLHLSCGGCRLCERCAKLDGEPCRMPDRMHPCVESHGINLIPVLEKNGLDFQYGSNIVTWFSLLFYND